MRKFFFLLALAFAISCHGQTVVVHGKNGSLEFYNGKNGTYNSVVYKNSKGQLFNIFDKGVEFYYDDGVDKYLSPDQSYFFVNFSLVGASGGDRSPTVESNEYLCAFVRMADGCVVRVETGGICGGAWSERNKWAGIDGLDVGKLDYKPPTVGKIFENYSPRSGGSSSKSTDLSGYLLPGTAIDNLLTCDPITDSNESYYRSLLKFLKLGKDRSKIENIIKEFHGSCPNC